MVVLGLCIFIAVPAVSAGQGGKTGGDDKAAKSEKAPKTEKAVKQDKAETKDAPKGSVAVVNGVPISREDFDREFLGVQEQSAGRGEIMDDARIAEAKGKVLDKLIDGELLYQESRKMGINVDDSFVDEQYNKFKEQFPSPEDFNKELEKVKLNETTLKSQIKQVMMIQQYIDREFVQKITVSDEEIKAFFDAFLKEKIEKNLRQEKIQNEVTKYIEKLRSTSAIQRNLP
jgi:hypothetical protein